MLNDITVFNICDQLSVSNEQDMEEKELQLRNFVVKHYVYGIIKK